jgi:hypothetical protein
VFNREQEVVGVFVRFSCAASSFKRRAIITPGTRKAVITNKQKEKTEKTHRKLGNNTIERDRWHKISRVF